MYLQISFKSRLPKKAESGDEHLAYLYQAMKTITKYTVNSPITANFKSTDQKRWVLEWMATFGPLTSKNVILPFFEKKSPGLNWHLWKKRKSLRLPMITVNRQTKMLTGPNLWLQLSLDRKLVLSAFMQDPQRRIYNYVQVLSQ